MAKKVGAYAMADMSHIAGLVVGGVHESPVPTHDVVMTTTTKTLRGPRSAIILSKAEHAAKIDKAVFPGMQGGPLEHIIAAKAVCFKEAMTDEYKEYQKQIAKNAKTLAETLMAEGLRLVSG
ncbi:MAG: serine hydroxymethyltransferase, partial [Acidobacteria bacterium]|nr:serine hydroxymethyltransferase [Acidobacteriota bacterium]